MIVGIFDMTAKQDDKNYGPSWLKIDIDVLQKQRDPCK